MPCLQAKDAALVMGRAGVCSENGAISFGYPGVTLRVAFTGTALKATLSKKHSSTSFLLIRVDDPGNADSNTSEVNRVSVNEGEMQTVVLVADLAESDHIVDIVHLTEAWVGLFEFVQFETDGAFSTSANRFPDRKLLFIGDSVTCGAVLDLPNEGDPPSASSNAYDSYGMRISRNLKAQCHLVAYGGRGLIRDYLGNHDWTGPKMFEADIPDDSMQSQWDHSAYVPDVVFISLGTNDLNLGIPDEHDFVAGYVAFLQRIRAVYPTTKIFITEGAIVNNNPTDKYSGAPVKTIMQEYLHKVAALAGDQVKAIPSNWYPGRADDPHPTNAEHELMARDFAPLLKGAMGW